MSELTAFWPALAAGLLVSATHVPLGAQVLARSIIFIDLAVAQVAVLGVVAAGWAGLEPHGVGVQLAALAAALLGALLFGWTERRWPKQQEALIGVGFVLAANAALLLLAFDPHGAEHLKDLLAGQVLWVTPAQAGIAALATALILAAWFAWGARSRIGFYVVFACAVTLSVQLVGLYLVFATLILPALAARSRTGGLAIAAAGYVAGLALSVLTDLPAGPLIVWTIAAAALYAYALQRLLRHPG